MFIAARILPQVRTLVIRDSFDYVNRHSIAYFTQEMSGNISNKVTQLNTGVLDGFNEFMMSTSMVMYVLIAIGILSFMNVWFFAAMMLWLALIVLVSWKLGQKAFGAFTGNQPPAESGQRRYCRQSGQLQRD